LEKLHKLTVLEDDAMPDDEDLAGDDDMYDESGDYYQDYDKRRENAKVQTPEAFNIPVTSSSFSYPYPTKYDRYNMVFIML
jgi:hypothetical protein